MCFRSSTGKRFLTTLFCGAVLSMTPLLAQTEAPQQGPPPPYAGDHWPGPGHRLEMLQRELNLTPDQVTQVKALFGTERARMETLRGNSALSNEDRHTQMLAIRQDSDSKLRAVLTPDQVTKYDAMQARMRARRQERENGGGPPPPPQGNPQ